MIFWWNSEDLTRPQKPKSGQQETKEGLSCHFIAGFIAGTDQVLAR